MQKTYKLILPFIAMMLIAAMSFGQADTVMVPQMVEGSPFGAINKFILGDTLDDGSRANPDRTYMLAKNKIYFLNGILSAHFNLKILGEPTGDGDKPPIITTGIDMSGAAAAPDLYIQCFDDATFKDVIVQLTPPNKQVEIAFSIQLLKENGKYMFDGVFFQGSRWLSIGSWAVNPSVTIQNCYFRNTQSTTDVFNGRGISFQNRWPDTVIMVNNTFFNMNSFALQGQASIFKYLRFEHNTLVNSVKWPIQWQWMTNAKIANNIFYNCHSYGEAMSERQDVNPDMLFGVINITDLPQDLVDSTELGLSEAGRIVYMNNNNWYYSSEITDYLAANDSIEGGIFMNARTSGYFTDAEGHPTMLEQNTTNMDPGFKNTGGSEASLAAWMAAFRAGQEVSYWGYDPDNDRFKIDWPVKEDLSYTNNDLFWGGDDGYPLGDLNWFPEKKAEWLTDVKYVEQPKNFTLQQNIPNPFSGETTIEYTITKTTDVNISVFDIQGRLVKELRNERNTPGQYTVTWDGTTNAGATAPTGVYFYMLRSEGSSATGKMTFLGK